MIRGFYEREGIAGVVTWANALWLALEAEYAIVRFGVRMLRSFVL